MSAGDVALLDTLTGWTVQVPGHPEVPPLLRRAAGHDDPVYLRLSAQSNHAPHGAGGRLQVLRRGTDDTALVVAVGPMVDPTLQAVTGLDVTVAYTHTSRPFDVAGLRILAGREVIIVEPYLAGTSSAVVERALGDVPHRVLSLGVGRADLRRYGTPADHARWHGLDAAGLRQSIRAFLG
jgi:transketolase